MGYRNFRIGNTLEVNVANGTPPFLINSSTVVPNLNVQLFNGQAATYYTNLSNMTGTLPVSKGGTGQTTSSGLIDSIIPSQTGQNGKYLTTDGTSLSWSTVASGGGGGATVLDDLTDVVITTPTTNQQLVYDGTNWVNVSKLDIPSIVANAGKVLSNDGTNLNWMSIHNSMNNTGFFVTLTKAAFVITNAAATTYSSASRMPVIGTSGTSVIYNPGNGYNNTTNIYTCPAGHSGYYFVIFSIDVSDVSGTADIGDLTIVKNDTTQVTNPTVLRMFNTTETWSESGTAHGIVYLNEGDTLCPHIRFGTAGTITFDTIYCGFSMIPLSGISSLNALSDVVITSPSTNQVLQYDGTNWVNNAPTYNISPNGITSSASLVVNTNNTIVTLDSFDKTLYRSVEYLIQLSQPNTNNFDIVKLLVVHNGTTSFTSKYGEAFSSSSLGTISSSISGNNVILQLSGYGDATTDNINIRIIKTIIVV